MTSASIQDFNGTLPDAYWCGDFLTNPRIFYIDPTKSHLMSLRYWNLTNGYSIVLNIKNDSTNQILYKIILISGVGGDVSFMLVDSPPTNNPM